MKIVKTMVLVSIMMNFLVGCSMKADSKPEYTQFVHSLPFVISQLDTSGMGVEIGELIDMSVWMQSRVYAYKEGENKISITKTHTRSNPDITVAYSVYLYEEKDNKLELIKHTAEQTGLIGSWKIPILVPSDVKLLVTNENNENWKPITRGTVKFVGKMTNSQTGGFGFFTLSKGVKSSILTGNKEPGLEAFLFKEKIDLEPAQLNLVLKGGCGNSRYNLRPKNTTLFLDYIPIQAFATCISGELGYQINYRLNPSALKILRKKEEKTDEIIISIGSQNFILPLSGFTFAETQTRRM